MASTRRTRREAEPIRITTAPHNADEDIDRRRRRYVMSMSIRTFCFIGAIIAGTGWLAWVLILGAVFLPYVAVVLANSSSPRIEGADLVQPHAGYKELE